VRCLAVNTATSALSIALVEGNEVLYFFRSDETRDQGNRLIRHIEEGLTATGLNYADLDVLGVVTGPGSFTGIRIGIAAMRALALAAEKPLVGITSFEMFCAAAERGAVHVVAVESWRGELYFSVTGKKGDALLPDMNVAPEECIRRLGALAVEGMTLSGDAAEKMKLLLPQARLVSMADARDVAALAIHQLCTQGGAGGKKPMPFYLRDADVTVSAKSVARKIQK